MNKQLPSDILTQGRGKKKKSKSQTERKGNGGLDLEGRKRLAADRGGGGHRQGPIFLIGKGEGAQEGKRGYLERRLVVSRRRPGKKYLRSEKGGV